MWESLLISTPTPLPPRSIGIIELERKLEIILGAEQLTGKILDLKNLARYLAGIGKNCIEDFADGDGSQGKSARVPESLARSVAQIAINQHLLDNNSPVDVLLTSNHRTSSIVPALAQNARTGHPEFRNGKGKQTRKAGSHRRDSGEPIWVI
jgi:hypothetical protein